MSNHKRTLHPRFIGAGRAAVLALTMLAGLPLAVHAQQTPAAAGPAPSSAPPDVGKAMETRPNDYPTLARVEYVFECLSDNPGPTHEMVYKCVCAADRVAEAVPYDRWVDLSTFFKAQPMAGERGAYVRERSDIQTHMKSYRQLQLDAKKACFIPVDGR